MKNNIPFHFPSKTGVCEISAHIYTPEDGWFETVMVIHHGMAEHQKRYEEYIRFLCVIICGVEGEDFCDVPIDFSEWKRMLIQWGNT